MGAVLLLPMVRVPDEQILRVHPTVRVKYVTDFQPYEPRVVAIYPGLRPGLVCYRADGAHPVVARMRHAIPEGQRPACIPAWGEAP